MRPIIRLTVLIFVLFLVGCAPFPYNQVNPYANNMYSSFPQGGPNQSVVRPSSAPVPKEKPTLTINPVIACAAFKADGADHDECLDYVKVENAWQRDNATTIRTTEGRVYEGNMQQSGNNAVIGNYRPGYGHPRYSSRFYGGFYNQGGMIQRFNGGFNGGFFRGNRGFRGHIGGHRNHNHGHRGGGHRNHSHGHRGGGHRGHR
jgi:hypothetical protein